MKKEEQQKSNEKVLEFLARNKSLENNGLILGTAYRLRSCNATVYRVNNGYILRSYKTIVACIVDGVGYDFLRYVYGYTTTSSQHIAKFFSDYKPTKVYTYKPL